MPRHKLGDSFYFTRYPDSDIALDLAEELRSDRQFGQPYIEERRFPTGLIRVSVLWDRWQKLTNLEARSKAIMRAYELAESTEYVKKIRLASGLTFPEAVSSGMLPYQIILAHRPEDPVSIRDCHHAMIEEGASSLVDARNPALLFSTEEQAKSARSRLIERLPGSESVWFINRQIGYSQGSPWDDEGDEV